MNGTAGGRGSVGDSGKHDVDGDAPDFISPLVDGVRVGSVDQAADKLGFAPLEPTALGNPLFVYIHDEVASPENEVMALVYQHVAFGRFAIVEQPAPMTQEELEGMATSCHPETGCEGSWTMIALANGTRALLISAPDISNGVIWLRGGLMFDVYGPGATFGPRTAETVANLLNALPLP